MSESRRLTDGDEMLFRQVHPAWVHDGRVSSQAFQPTTKDAGKLSVSQKSKTSAEAAFTLHTKDKGLASAGVWGVTVSECDALDLPSHEAPVEAPVRDPAHARVDFTGKSRGKQKSAAQGLRNLASERGCIYAAADDR